MEGIILLAALVVLVIAYFFAKEFQHIAEMKGHTGTKYFWWCFLFAAVGMFMVIALPDRGDSEKTGVLNVPSDELPEL